MPVRCNSLSCGELVGVDDADYSQGCAMHPSCAEAASRDSEEIYAAFLADTERAAS